jgi:hypothetical protein
MKKPTTKKIDTKKKAAMVKKAVVNDAGISKSAAKGAATKKLAHSVAGVTLGKTIREAAKNSWHGYYVHICDGDIHDANYEAPEEDSDSGSEI